MNSRLQLFVGLYCFYGVLFQLRHHVERKFYILNERSIHYVNRVQKISRNQRPAILSRTSGNRHTHQRVSSTTRYKSGNITTILQPVRIKENSSFRTKGKCDLFQTERERSIRDTSQTNICDYKNKRALDTDNNRRLENNSSIWKPSVWRIHVTKRY